MLASVLHLSRLALILAPAACALAACIGSHDTADTTSESSSSSSGSSTGAGGAGGNKSYFGNTTATTSTGPDSVLHCTGDAGAWSQLTEEPIPARAARSAA